MNVLQKLKNSAKALKTEVSAIYLSLNDNRTPLLAKVMVMITVCYALSPIDLIPDFIPILGYLDDLIILPILIAASIRAIPKEVLEECRIKAREESRLNKKLGFYSAAVIILLWIGVAAYVVSRFFKGK